MKILPLLGLALLLAACGESTQTERAGDAPDAPSTGLVARAEPLAVGEDAPVFRGLPDGGKTIVVFYRGPW